MAKRRYTVVLLGHGDIPSVNVVRVTCKDRASASRCAKEVSFHRDYGHLSGDYMHKRYGKEWDYPDRYYTTVEVMKGHAPTATK